MNKKETIKTYIAFVIIYVISMTDSYYDKTDEEERNNKDILMCFYISLLYGLILIPYSSRFYIKCVTPNKILEIGV